MATKEARSSHAVRERASAWGVRLFRNNSGVLMNDVGIPVRFGLGNESSKTNKDLKTGDYIGWTPVTITPEMVGKTLPVFTNMEVKASGFKTRETYNKNSREHGQNNFNQIVVRAGGIAGFTSGAADVDLLINEFIARVTKWVN